MNGPRDNNRDADRREWEQLTLFDLIEEEQRGDGGND